MANYVTATFNGSETKAVATGLWQWDYGQTLRVEGLNLPRTLEVHFHQRTRQWLMYGVTVDGVMTVSIPNEFLQYAQPVVAYIYLHDAETDGETQYEITLPVVAREKPVNYDDTDPATTAAYQALVDATTLLRDDIEVVQGYANEASDHATAAEGYAINAEDAAAQAAASATAAGAASDTAQAAATAAAQSATQAAGSAQTANASAQNADQSAQDAAQSAQEAAQTVQTVEDAAEQVAADKAAVEAAADTFTETTVPAATAAVQQEGAIQIAAINAAGTTQTGNVNSAGSTQTAAVNVAGATQIQAVTAKGEEYIEEIDTLIEAHIDDTLTQTGMAADAKKTGDEIADLKDANNETRRAAGIRTPTYTVTSGKAMVTATTALVDSGMFSFVNPIAISKGETIAVTVSTFNTTMGIIATCDANNTSRRIWVASDGNDNTRYTYTATEDGYVCLTIRNSDANPDIIIYRKTAEQVEQVKTALEYDEIFIKEIVGFSDAELTIDKGSFWNNQGVYTAFAADQNFQTAELSIVGGEYYRIKASCAYGNALYAFVDGNNTVISIVLDTSGSSAGTDFYGTVKAPYNAAKLRVGTCRGDGTLAVGIADGVAIPNNEYEGIRWAVFGDSLTEVNTTAAKKYYNWVAEKYGMSIVNYGASGTGYWSSHDDNKAFYQRMASVDPDDFDFMTIFGSGNDIKFLKNNTFPLGTANDYGSLSAEPTTLGSAINRTIEQFQTLCPTTLLGLITPTPWAAYCTAWRMNRDDALLMQNYADLIKEIGYIRGIPVLNLFNCSNLRPWDATFRATYYKENGFQDLGTHPNSLGHKLIASQFDVFIHSMFFAVR